MSDLIVHVDSDLAQCLMVVMATFDDALCLHSLPARTFCPGKNIV